MNLARRFLASSVFSKAADDALFPLLDSRRRQWVDLKKTIYRQAPAKRPKVSLLVPLWLSSPGLTCHPSPSPGFQTRPESGFKAWCFDRAAQKHGWWTKGMTVLYVAHIVILS